MTESAFMAAWWRGVANGLVASMVNRGECDLIDEALAAREQARQWQARG